MSAGLNLPNFDVPDLKNKSLSAKEYYDLNLEGIKRLEKSGRLKEVMADPRRVPINARFTLH